MKKVSIFLCRHGQTNGNTIKDLKLLGTESLNDVGIKQVEHLASLLVSQKDKPNAIYSSPLNRALQTAKIISNVLKIPIIEEERLKEYDFGVYKGKIISKNDIYKDLTSQEERFHFRLPQGESDADVVNRISSFISDLSQKNVIIITHDYPAFVIKKLLEGKDKQELISIPFQTMEHGSFLKIQI